MLRKNLKQVEDQDDINRKCSNFNLIIIKKNDLATRCFVDTKPCSFCLLAAFPMELLLVLFFRQSTSRNLRRLISPEEENVQEKSIISLDSKKIIIVNMNNC